MLVTSPPPKDIHWWLRLFIESKDGNQSIIVRPHALIGIGLVSCVAYALGGGVVLGVVVVVIGQLGKYVAIKLGDGPTPTYGEAWEAVKLLFISRRRKMTKAERDDLKAKCCVLIRRAKLADLFAERFEKRENERNARKSKIFVRLLQEIENL